VTARDGRRVELFGVAVAADTMRGIELRSAVPRTVAVAVADVTKVEVQRPSAGLTALAIVGVPVAFVVLMGVVVASTWKPWFQ
jgi:hypothetical protein